MATELYYTPLFQDSALKGYWRLENANDSSPSGYNLTAVNTPTVTTGLFGNAYTFQGASSQYMTIANASCPDLEISGDQTWICWYKKTSGSDHSVIGKTLGSDPTNKKKRIYINNTNNPTFNMAGVTDLVSTESISNGSWYMLAGIYDRTNTTIKIWVNAVKTEQTKSAAATATGAPFAIGRDGDYSNYANGIIDEVMIFNRALTDDEITRYYNGSLVSMGFIM